MNVSEFALWLKSNFNFDCFENDLFEKSLYAAVEDFEASTYDGITYPEYFKDDLNNAFLKRYVLLLARVVKSIPELDSPISLNLYKIHLNSYSNYIVELQSSIQRLES
jgi:hypothetical protein